MFPIEYSGSTIRFTVLDVEGSVLRLSETRDGEESALCHFDGDQTRAMPEPVQSWYPVPVMPGDVLTWERARDDTLISLLARDGRIVCAVPSDVLR